MRTGTSRILVTLIASAAAISMVMPGQAMAHQSGGSAQHVLLLSVDGLHQSDLMWWVRSNPMSNLARLARGGTEYTDASTPVPSDSFPGLIAQVTGGDPRTTGVFYDVSFNRGLLARVMHHGP